MKIPIFLSYPRPFLKTQEIFITHIMEYLKHRGLEPRTLGVDSYDMNAPLKAIRRLMMEANGLITVAFRRSLIKDGIIRPRTDLADQKEEPIQESWLTSPWCHIEPAMAYQLGLPILIIRENGVIADGILEKGITGLYMPTFELPEETGSHSGNELKDKVEKYFCGNEWVNLIGQWEGYVRTVVETKGRPPKLY
jgi:hypothetical protein